MRNIGTLGTASRLLPPLQRGAAAILAVLRRCDRRDTWEWGQRREPDSSLAEGDVPDASRLCVSGLEIVASGQTSVYGPNIVIIHMNHVLSKAVCSRAPNQIVLHPVAVTPVSGSVSC